MQIFLMLLAAAALIACSPVRHKPRKIDVLETTIGKVQNFGLEEEDAEVELPNDYVSRFDGHFSDIGNKTPVKDVVPNESDDIAEPDIDFIEHLDPEESMAMFGDTDEEVRIFYVKSEIATIYRQHKAHREPVQVLKKGQRIKASLENGWAKIADKYYMSLDSLSLTPVRTVRAAKN